MLACREAERFDLNQRERRVPPTRGGSQLMRPRPCARETACARFSTLSLIPQRGFWF